MNQNPINKALYVSSENEWELLEYVELLANEVRPQYEVGVDGNLETISRWSETFWERYQTNQIRIPFTRKQMTEIRDIIRVVDAFGMYRVKFWHAVVFIYDLTMDHYSSEVYIVPAPLKEIFAKMAEYMDNHSDVSLTLSSSEDSSKLKVNNKASLSLFKGFISRWSEIRNENLVMIDVDNPEKTNFSASRQIWYVYVLFDKLFTILNLPKLRSKQSYNIFYERSYNKKLLISRLICLMELTPNKKPFWESDNALKGFIKQYKHKEVPTTISKIYY